MSGMQKPHSLTVSKLKGTLSHRHTFSYRISNNHRLLRVHLRSFSYSVRVGLNLNWNSWAFERTLYIVYGVIFVSVTEYFEQVVKIISKRRIATAHGRFTSIRQVSSMCIPSTTCFLGPSGVHIPNGMSIGSALFAGLVSVIDRPTDRQTTLLAL